MLCVLSTEGPSNGARLAGSGETDKERELLQARQTFEPISVKKEASPLLRELILLFCHLSQHVCNEVRVTIHMHSNTMTIQISAKNWQIYKGFQFINS